MDAELEKRLDKLQRELELIKASYESLQKTVEKQQNVVFGTDSQPGLVTRIAVIEEKIREVSNKIDDIDLKIDELNRKINNTSNKTMIYILMAISVMDGLISVLVALFH